MSRYSLISHCKFKLPSLAISWLFSSLERFSILIFNVKILSPVMNTAAAHTSSAPCCESSINCGSLLVYFLITIIPFNFIQSNTVILARALLIFLQRIFQSAHFVWKPRKTCLQQRGPLERLDIICACLLI